MTYKPKFNLIGISVILLVLIMSSCEDGIKLPWSEDDPVIDTTAVSEPDSISEVSDSEIATADSLQNYQDSVEAAEQSSSLDVTSDVKMWRLVVSSMPTEELAARFKTRYNLDQGEIMYVDYLNTYRVVHSSYSDLSKAQEEFASLKSRFPKAWLVRF